jgi:nickel-dependent lactate racemase
LLARVEGAPTPLPDGWQVQIQAQIQRAAAVSLYSSLSDEAVRSALLVPCHDVGAQVRRLLAARGPEARLLVLPEGPQTVVCPALSAPLV